jgi:hypothetical protein
MKIAFVTIATNKYAAYAENLLQSMNEFAFNYSNSKVTLFVFSNVSQLFKNNFGRILTKGINISHVPFPLISLLRYHYYADCSELNDYDYVFHIDCDMIFKSNVKEEILSKRVCVSHPGMRVFKNSNDYPYDRNLESNAYVPFGIGKEYYQNCFQGGEANEFISMCKILRNRCEEDLRKNYIALWHDESYMNKYMVENEPTLVLPSTYAQPESWPLFGETKILHVDKKHLQMRITE